MSTADKRPRIGRIIFWGIWETVSVWVLVTAVLALAGCTTRASQHFPMTIVDGKGIPHKVIQRIVYPADSSWDKPAVKDTIYQTCPFENWDPKTDVLMKLEDCVNEHTHANGMTYTTRTHDSNGPILSNAVPAAIIAGGIVGGAAVHRPSKTSVNATGGTNRTDINFEDPPHHRP
jgi:hypothetical protein